MYKLMMALARLMAVLGGLVLTALILLTCVSVLGRSINGILHTEFMQTWLPAFSEWGIAIGIGPVNGDFEIVEAGIAFAIFAFLPLCQITVGHASVDVFSARFPTALNRLIRTLVEITFAVVLVTIAVRLFVGMEDKMRYGETTLLLQFPIWWSYAASTFAAGVAAIVAIYVAAIRVIEMLTGRTLLIDGSEAGH